MDIGIVSGGETYRDFLLDYIDVHAYSYWIGVDSGICAMKDAGIIPNLIVGDLDSADPEVIRYYNKFDFIKWQKFPPEKDWTDFELAVMSAVKMKPERITVFGGTGTRLDHTISSISIMKYAVTAGIFMEIVDPWQRIFLCTGENIIRREDLFGPYISFLPYGGVAENVTLEGFKYPLHHENIDPWESRTISNEAVSDVMKISVGKGWLICFESSDVWHGDES